MNQGEGIEGAKIIERANIVNIRSPSQVSHDPGNEQPMIFHVEAIELSIDILTRNNLIGSIFFQMIWQILIFSPDKRRHRTHHLLSNLLQQQVARSGLFSSIQNIVG